MANNNVPRDRMAAQREKRRLERIRRKQRRDHAVRILKYMIVLLFAALIVATVFLFVGQNSGKDTKPRRQNAKETNAVDETIVAELQSLEDQDVLQVVQLMTSVEESRWLEESASIYESESIEQSIAMSIAMEESSMEASVAQSLYESSVAESSAALEYELLNAPLAGSHLTARSVTYGCDDSDIPYLRKLFKSCVVIGNSRAKNAVDCGIMTENEVKYMSGVSVEVITPFAVSQAYLYRPKTLFIMGLNDVAYYDRDAERFKQDYTSMVRQYLAINPSSEIYCMESLPLPEEAWSYFYRAMTSLPDFNAAIRSMCEENGWHYVSASDYADFSYINSEDHAHYGKDFYYLWAQTMATQLHLWEDLAGLGYEIR